MTTKIFATVVFWFSLVVFARCASCADGDIYVTNQDTIIAYTKEDLEAATIKLVLKKDEAGVDQMIRDGKIGLVTKGSEAHIVDSSLLSIVAQVRFKDTGQRAWIHKKFLTLKSKDNKSSAGTIQNPIKAIFKKETPERKPPQEKKAGTYLEGIFYEGTNPVVIIGGKSYHINDTVCDGQIVNVFVLKQKGGAARPEDGLFEPRVKIRFKDREGIYKVGDRVGD